MSRGEVISKKRVFAKRILEWYEEHGSSFPWRRTKDPYKILVSEMLLRKTTRKQVAKIFHQFFRFYPSFEDLASAAPKQIKKAIRPLGMEHRRSILLKNLAEEVAAKYSGRLPLEEGVLLELPGVGQYAANAVLCFAKGKKVPLVDTNSIRVVQRVFSIKSRNRRARTDRAVWDFVSSLMPRRKYKEFNLAVLDFAGSICLPKNPRCASCPVNPICDFYKGVQR